MFCLSILLIHVLILHVRAYIYIYICGLIMWLLLLDFAIRPGVQRSIGPDRAVFSRLSSTSRWERPAVEKGGEEHQRLARFEHRHCMTGSSERRERKPVVLLIPSTHLTHHRQNRKEKLPTGLFREENFTETNFTGFHLR